MEQSLLPSLLDFGALGLFTGFLIWQYNKTQNRLQEIVERFQKSVQDQEMAHNKAEELIRTRYDAVIARHELQRENVYKDVVQKLDDHGRILLLLERRLMGNDGSVGP